MNPSATFINQINIYAHLPNKENVQGIGSADTERTRDIILVAIGPRKQQGILSFQAEISGAINEEPAGQVRAKDVSTALR
jgi:hypothetical protein